MGRKDRRERNRELYNWKRFAIFAIVLALVSSAAFFTVSIHSVSQRGAIPQPIIEQENPLTDIQIHGTALRKLNNMFLENENVTEFMVCGTGERQGDTYIVDQSSDLHQPIVTDSSIVHINVQDCEGELTIHSHPWRSTQPSGTDLISHSSFGHLVSCVMYDINSFNCYQASYNEIKVTGELKS